MLLVDYRKAHRKIEGDLAWLESKLQLAPEMMGERVPQLQNPALPIYKTRCKDSYCNIGQSGGWRIYYAVNKDFLKISLLFLHHIREYETPRREFLIQELERAFQTGLEQLC